MQASPDECCCTPNGLVHKPLSVHVFGTLHCLISHMQTRISPSHNSKTKFPGLSDVDLRAEELDKIIHIVDLFVNTVTNLFASLNVTPS